jgi:predicted Zn finger-like uncharacterized protein
MIVNCPDCGATYEITHQKEWGAAVKVRCPRCKAVFPIPEAGAPARAERTAAPPRQAARPRIVDPVVARRLARAMVSEIVLVREREREEALREHTLLSRFGPAIASAYAVYRGKVSPRLPGSRRIFRDAVNELLGGGEPLL